MLELYNRKLISVWDKFLEQLTGVKANTPPAKPRKKSDTTKFTQIHYDAIMKAHIDMLAHNAAFPDDKWDTEGLTAHLNKKLKLDKSRSCYSLVWRNKVDRDSLATGNRAFTY